MNRFGVAALTVASVFGVAMPVKAQHSSVPVSTVAYEYASVFCRLMDDGSSIQAATKEALRVVSKSYFKQVYDPSFNDLATNISTALCPYAGMREVENRSRAVSASYLIYEQEYCRALEEGKPIGVALSSARQKVKSALPALNWFDSERQEAVKRAYNFCPNLSNSAPLSNNDTPNKNYPYIFVPASQ